MVSPMWVCREEALIVLLRARPSSVFEIVLMKCSDGESEYTNERKKRRLCFCDRYNLDLYEVIPLCSIQSSLIQTH